MRRCSQLNACWVLPLGRSTQREDASTLIPEVHVGERMKVESWIGNKRDCHCKTFQKHLFCDLSNLCQGGKSKRCDWDRTVRVSQRTCRRLLWTLQTQRSPELFMRIHSTQKITWFDSGYLTLNEGFFFLRKKISCILSCQKRRPRTTLPSVFSAVRSLRSNRNAVAEI